MEQDADAVMLLYRKEYYLKNDPRQNDNERFAKWVDEYETAKGKAEIIVAKNRQGEARTVHLKFDGVRQVFEDAPWVG